MNQAERDALRRLARAALKVRISGTLGDDTFTTNATDGRELIAGVDAYFVLLKEWMQNEQRWEDGLWEYPDPAESNLY